MVEEVIELTEEEEEQAYLDAFAEEAKKLSAENEHNTAGVAGGDEDSPDDKTLEPDGTAKTPSAKGKASDGKSAESDDPYAWITDLPEHLRKRAKALQHTAVSDAGRVAALQRRLNDNEARLKAKELSYGAGRAKAPSSSPAKKEDKPLSPKLKEFVESYPQLAESVREMVNNDRQELEQMIDSRLAPINEETTYRRLAAARSRLEDGASKIFDTPNSRVHYSDVLKSELYKDKFLPSQPAEFQQMARTTQDPDTALWVLEQFHSFAVNYAEENGLVDNASPKSKADKTSERRSARKATAGTPPSRSAITDEDDTLDYEAIFRQMNS